MHSNYLNQSLIAKYLSNYKNKLYFAIITMFYKIVLLSHEIVTKYLFNLQFYLKNIIVKFLLCEVIFEEDLILWKS